MSTQVDIETTNDSWTNIDNPNTNFDASDMRIRQNLGVARDIAFISFNLAPIPPGQIIDVGVFHGKVKTSKVGYGACPMYKNDAAFVETIITWNNMPGIDGASIGNFKMDAVGWQTTDITSTIQGWYDGHIDSDGFRIHPPNSNEPVAAELFRHESAGNEPFLRIDYSPKPIGFGGPMIKNWIFMKEAWEKHDKIWKPEILVPEVNHEY